MFHQGDIQSGITRSIQEGKVVTCFVRDDGPESRTWEETYLVKPELSEFLAAKSVVLRINLGSQEAAFLSAFCPVAQAPTLVVINNGQLREVLSGGITYDDLFSRLTRAIDPDVSTSRQSNSNEQPQSSSTSQAATPSDQPNQESTVSTANEATSSASGSTNPTPSSSQSSSEVQNMLQERRHRLEAERKAREEKEEADRIARAKAKRQAADAAAGGQPGSSRPAEADYAAQERKRKQDDRKERERVRQLVENDKIERKEREAQRKEALAAERQSKQSESLDQKAPSSSATVPANACAVQVRLFDGSTIRTRFNSPATETLASAVRMWVDSNLQSADGAKRSAIPPYTFKHILTPLPNRTLEVGEEEKTLQDLGLTPTATLVLVPVQGYTEAYANSGVSGWLSWLYGTVAGAFLLVINFLKGIVGVTGGTGAADSTQAVAQPRGAGESQSGSAGKKDESRPSTKMKTLRDTKDEKDDRQWYNGNQLNFEPRPEDKDKKDE